MVLPVERGGEAAAAATAAAATAAVASSSRLERTRNSVLARQGCWVLCVLCVCCVCCVCECDQTVSLSSFSDRWEIKHGGAGEQKKKNQLHPKGSNFKRSSSLFTTKPDHHWPGIADENALTLAILCLVTCNKSKFDSKLGKKLSTLPCPNLDPL